MVEQECRWWTIDGVEEGVLVFRVGRSPRRKDVIDLLMARASAIPGASAIKFRALMS